MEGVAQFTYNGTAQDELSFSQGNVLKIISFTEDRNWFKAELNNQTGFVPKNYVKMKPNLWYMGNMTRVDAERFLMRPNEPGSPTTLADGSFIVRDSESTPNSFAISVRFGQQVQHYKILRNNEGNYRWFGKFKIF